MSRKLLIFIVAFTLALVAFVVWWFTRPAPQVNVQPVNTTTEVTPAELQPWQTTTSPAVPATPEQVAQTSAKNFALRFVEIYGSYSSDAPYQNLKTVDYMFTSNFKQIVEAQTAQTEPAGGFYGVTTKALTAQVSNQTESSATVLISTQRQELFSRTGEPQLRYQDIKVTLVKQGQSWLVESAEWQ